MVIKIHTRIPVVVGVNFGVVGGYFILPVMDVNVVAVLLMQQMVFIIKEGISHQKDIRRRNLPVVISEEQEVANRRWVKQAAAELLIDILGFN
ncbi:hypothetical protein ES703_93787 [subsurface metagenome]